MNTNKYVKNCWMCGNGVRIIENKDTKTFAIQCQNCLKNGLTIKCETDSYDSCIDVWNNSRTILTDEDIYNIILNLTKVKDVNTHLIRKLNSINTYNTGYIYENDNRFGYGAIIDPKGNLCLCDRPHIEVMLKYFNIDYDTLIPENIDKIYRMIMGSEVFKQSFVKITLYATILSVEIPIKKTDAQIKSLILYFKENASKFSNVIQITIQNDITGRDFNFNSVEKAIMYLMS